MLWRRLLIVVVFVLAQVWFLPSVSAAIVFSDVASNNPHYQAIQALSEQGVIEGYPGNQFRPNQQVNRAEALKIILLGSDILVPDIQPTEIFPDVVSGIWYAKYVAKAKNLEIINGDSVTELFRPGDTINLAEILKILLKTNEVQTKSPSASPYPDVPKEAWFSSYFDYAKLVNLLEIDSKGLVHPDTPINRGMMAELMHRLQTKPKADDYGKASFYGGKFHGRTTASGDVFDASLLTAAHRTYPFGTWLKVTNVENNKSVTVRVNDRGPYGDPERVVDLSKAAFQEIAPLSRGVIWVTFQATNGPALSIAPRPPTVAAPELNTMRETCPERNGFELIPQNAFANMELVTRVPTRVVSEEILQIRGHLQSPSSDKVTAFFTDEQGNQTAFSAIPDSAGDFSIDLFFPGVGNYNFGIIPGASGTSVVTPVKVLSYACLAEEENRALQIPTPPSIHLNDGETFLQWDTGDYNLFQLSFIQGSHFKRFLVNNRGSFKIPTTAFVSFLEAPVNFHFRAAHRTASSVLLEEKISWSPPAVMSLPAVTHHERIVEKNQIEVTNLPNTVSPEDLLHLSINTKTSLRSQAALILPDGKTEMVEMTSRSAKAIKNQNNILVFPPGTSSLTLRYRIRQAGLHFLEINNAEGLAALNIPLYPTGSLPLLPNPSELAPRKAVDLGSNLDRLRQDFLGLINQDRATYGRAPLTLDTPLNSLAELRANDMANNHYFGHWNAEGLSVNELRNNFGITQVVSENLAKDVTPALAEYGLMRSAIHRANILNADWTRAGLGLAKNSEGSYLFVQIFSGDPFDLRNLDGLRQTLLTAVNLQRATPFIFDATLNTLAQAWSDSMVQNDFFAFTDSDGQSLFDTVEAAALHDLVGTYLVGNTSFNEAREQILKNTALKEGNWKKLGIGIRQDSLGVFKITLIYSE